MRELLAEGHDFSLFDAVDLIERIAAEPRRTEGAESEAARDADPATGASAPGTPIGVHRAGAYQPPSKENVRFRAVTHMGFPAADIARITLEDPPADSTGERRSRYVIEATCLGLYGPESPLPAHVNERIVARDRDAAALRDFLDLFNHRILTLLCRIGRRYRHVRAFDGIATDEISLLCGALGGEPDPDTAASLDEARSHRLRNTTRLGRFSLSARALEAMISDRFGGIGVRVDEFVRRTVHIRDEQRNRLGVRGNILGESALLGDHVVSRISKIRVWLGPLAAGRLDGFLPGGAARRTLDALLRRVLAAPFDHDVMLRVAPRAVTPSRLARRGALALDAWLGEPPRETTLRFRAAA